MQIDEMGLLDYAYDKFNAEKYQEALDAFILAYREGYERELVLENIYNCYVNGNEQEFRRIYEQQRIREEVSYEDCILDFVPYQDGEYYIFDKELCDFRGKFSIHDWKKTEKALLLKNMEFSSAVVELEWNWELGKNVIVDALERDVYVIFHDIRRASSFCKIPELSEYIKNIKCFLDHQEMKEYFHKNTAVYLPKIIHGNAEDKIALAEIMEQEHQYRLTPEGRNTENVLLTIGIPTHDRGNLLLKRLEKLREMPYDAEVEIAISKNGTHYYQEEYKSVELIQDARINYVGYDKELLMADNWYNVIKIACGKFVLIVSDEDDVIIEALEHYLKYLSTHKDLGMLRARTMVQYKELDRSQCYKKGEEAFIGGFLRGNYLSGGIYNRELLMNCNIEYYNKYYRENTFYWLYPHMWWQAMLAFEGDYATDIVFLVREGETVIFEEMRKYEEMKQKGEDIQELCGHMADGNESLTQVSEYQSRLEQFWGCVLLIKDFEKLNEELKARALFLIMNKTLYLMVLVRDDYQYKKTEFPMWCNRFVESLLKAFNELSVDKEFQEKILRQLLFFLEETEAKS